MGPNPTDDPGDGFEAFRREKTMRRMQREGHIDRKAEIHRKTLEQIEEGERQEILEAQLQREVNDFVASTTRLAAEILQGLSEEQAELLSRQISGEMKDFFQVTLARVEELVEGLRRDYGDEVADRKRDELETHLRNLSPEALDQYRAEGSAEAARLHMGQGPEAEPSAQTGAAEPELAREPSIDELLDHSGGAGTSGREDDDASRLEAKLRWKATTPEPDRERIEDPPEEVDADDEFADTSELAGKSSELLERLTKDPTRLQKALDLMIREGLIGHEDVADVFEGDSGPDGGGA